MNKETVTNLTAAIGILGQCKSVEEWNDKREAIKSAVLPGEWVRYFVPAIDASGLIVRVLGRDTARARRYN
jgi:hypothetical protein